MSDYIMALITRREISQLRFLLCKFMDYKHVIVEDFPYGNRYDNKVSKSVINIKNFLDILIYGPEDE